MHSTRPSPLNISLIYAVVAAGWILVSDSLVGWFLQTPEQITLVSTLKGYFFVFCTSVLLYGLLRWRSGEEQSGSRLQMPSSLVYSLSILLLTLTAGLYTLHKKEASEGARLQNMVEVRLQMIDAWLAERQVDAQILFSDPFLSHAYRRWRQKGDLAGRDYLFSHLAVYARQGIFEVCVLFDENGQILWQSKPLDGALDPDFRQSLLAAASRSSVTRLRPQREASGQVRLDFLCPLQTKALPATPGPMVLLRGYPARHLPAGLFAWTGTRSGEMVLFQREGQEIYYLHPLGVIKNQRLPLSQPQLLAARVAAGEVDKPLKALDYAGRPVLGVGSEVPGTGWFLLAKLERSEIYALAATDLVWISLAGLLGLLSAGTAARLNTQRQQLAIAAATRQAQEERMRATRLLAAIVDSSSDAIFAKDLQGRYLLFNRAAQQWVHKTEQEVLGQDDRAIFPENVDQICSNDQKVLAENASLTFQEQVGSSTFQVAKAPIHDETGQIIGICGVSRDITRRLEAERERQSQLEELRRWQHLTLGREERVLDLKEQVNRLLVASGQPPAFSSLDSSAEQGPLSADQERRALLSLLEDERLAQQELRESEMRYRILADNVVDVIWLFDLQEQRFTYVTPSNQTLTGFSREEVLQMSMRETMTAESFEQVSALLAQALAAVSGGDESLRKSTLELEIVTKGGRIIPVEVAAGLVSDQAGRITHLQGVTRDISQRKQMESQLREREETLSLLARRAEALLTLPEAAERMPEDLFLQHGLELAKELTGSQVAAVHFHALDHERDAPADEDLQINLADIFGDEQRQRQTLILNECSLRSVKRLVRVPVMESGKVVMLAGLGNKLEEYQARDAETLQMISNELWRLVQRRRAQSELAKLSQALEQCPDSIVITNLNAQIEYVNEAFVQISGYSRSELLGKNPRVLQSGSTPKQTFVEMWSELTRGQPWKGQLTNRRKDGSVYDEFAHIAPIRQADGSVTHYLAVKQDITEKKRLGEELDRHRHHLEDLVKIRTAELEEARARAESANRAKSTFLANMSHEIRTPMNAILGLTYLLQLDQVTPAQALRLTKIDNAAHHLLAIINDILDVSKIEASKLVLEEADFLLEEVIEGACALVRDSAADKGLTLVVELGGVPPWLRGDSTRLRQALLNYVSNAVKFTERGGLTVRAQLLEESQGRLLVKFEVEDSGIGIAAEELEGLFRNFQQADATTTRKYGGTGLGLAITGHLARLMGGEAGAESQPGQGSRFWFTVRLARGQGEVPASPSSGPKHLLTRYQKSTARLLLVEDNPINREVANELLQVIGLAVDTAENGQQAIAMAEAKAYDLILMDVQMPILDGLEATRAIRALPGWSHRPILAMSASAFTEERQACLDAGMNDFVAKPVEPQALYATLQRWLSAETETRAPESAPDSPAWPSIEGVDSRGGLARVAGNQDLYRSLLVNLAGHHQATLEKFQSALDSGRMAVLRGEAHSLKGVAGNLGLTTVQDQAAQLERLAQSDSPLSTLQENLSLLKETLAQVSAHIQEALSEASQPVPAARLAEDQLLGLVDALERHLLRQEGESFDCLERLVPHLKMRLPVESVKQLTQALEQLDFEGALRRLRDLKQALELPDSSE